MSSIDFDPRESIVRAFNCKNKDSGNEEYEKTASRGHILPFVFHIWCCFNPVPTDKNHLSLPKYKMTYAQQVRENIPTKYFRSQLGALWEPADQRLRGQINNPSSRSYGWGQRVIADTFLPCCSEPQQGHPEPLDTPAALVIIIVHRLLFSSRNWFTVLYCTCQRALECDRHHDNLRVRLFFFSFRTENKKTW